MLQTGEPLRYRISVDEGLVANTHYQQHRRSPLCPTSPQIVEQIERSQIGPLHIINEEDKRVTFGQSLTQARHGLKETITSCCLVSFRSRQVRVAIAQFWQQAAEFGQPGIVEQVIGSILPLKAVAQ